MNSPRAHARRRSRHRAALQPRKRGALRRGRRERGRRPPLPDERRARSGGGHPARRGGRRARRLRRHLPAPAPELTGSTCESLPSDESPLRVQLLDWSLERVREKGGERVMGFAWAPDERMRRALADAGFERTRGSYRMGIEFDGELEEPRPAGRDANPADDAGGRTGRVRRRTRRRSRTCGATRRRPFEEWQHWLLGDDHDWSLFFVAEADGEPAGVALCRPSPPTPKSAAIRVVGVRRPWRRKGVGTRAHAPRSSPSFVGAECGAPRWASTPRA